MSQHGCMSWRYLKNAWNMVAALSLLWKNMTKLQYVWRCYKYSFSRNWPTLHTTILTRCFVWCMILSILLFICYMTVWMHACWERYMEEIQLSVRIYRQKVDDESQREWAAFCSSSVVSSWVHIHVTDRSGGYFNQQATVERCPTVGDSFKTYWVYTSVGMEIMPIWV